MLCFLKDKTLSITYWMIIILLKNNETREALRASLMANGIETRPLFYPAHTMPML
jgi:perosamine synthetase